MGGDENSSLKELENLLKSVDSEEKAKEMEGIIKSLDNKGNIKMIATDIAIDELAKNPKISKKRLWVNVMIRTGGETGEVLKRDAYNQIITQLDKEDYKI